MKRIKLALMTTSVLSVLASACTSEAASSAKTNTKSTKPTANIKNVQVTITPKELDVGPFSKKASEITVNDVTASFTNPADNSKYVFNLENTIPVIENKKNVSDQNGEIFFRVKITNRINPTEISYQNVLVTGLRKSNDGYIDLKTQDRFAPDDLFAYNKLDRYHQFLLDNNKYMIQLKQAIASRLQHSPTGTFDLKQFRTDVKTSDQDKQYFDQQAQKYHLNTYDDSLIKGFGVPIYQDHSGTNPTVQGINLYNGEMNKFPSWRDVFNRDQYKANGLPRILPNQEYKNIALQTYSLSVDNKDTNKKDIEELGTNSIRRTRGTVWILDYEKTNNGKYPTRWYFGTNLHVADAITNNTTGVLFSILKPQVGLKTIIAPADGVDQTYFDNYYIPNLKVRNEGVALFDKTNGGSNNTTGQPVGIRTVFTADDYLKTDPKDYLVLPQEQDDAKNTAYSQYHEFLDFAVIEVDFKALWEQSINSKADNLDNNHGFNTPEAYAHAFTRGYADEANKAKQIKFLSQSYLSDYSRVNYPFTNTDHPNQPVDLRSFDTFFLLGYPLSQADWGFDSYQDSTWAKRRGETVSLWVNGEPGWYDNPGESITGQRADKVGDQLSTNVGYQTFPDKPGIVDSFISASRAGDNFYSSPDHRGGKKLIDFGLEYVPRHYAPYGGSSGSSMRNQKNELVGVFHVGNSFAMAGLAAAFRSEGFNYHGLYGKYNLPQYDLIYGGGKEQQKSFRQSLEKLYGDNYHTNLFANINQIPDQFKFHDNNEVQADSLNQQSKLPSHES